MNVYSGGGKYVQRIGSNPSFALTASCFPFLHFDANARIVHATPRPYQFMMCSFFFVPPERPRRGSKYRLYSKPAGPGFGRWVWPLSTRPFCSLVNCSPNGLSWRLLLAEWFELKDLGECLGVNCSPKWFERKDLGECLGVYCSPNGLSFKTLANALALIARQMV